jgi:cysteinyl-tRNA synthetase
MRKAFSVFVTNNTLCVGEARLLGLLNSMTCKLEKFQPANIENVIMYTCGPSIYQLPHIGNYRTFLYEDVLLRYLAYSGYKVKRVLFITDVEDKAIAEAKKEKTTVKELTKRNEAFFIKELGQLGAKRPTYVAKASTSINSAVEIIETLLEKGYAYQYEGDVYYDPLKFKAFGKLYRLDVSRWPSRKHRFHKDTYPGSRWNLGDFIIWHKYQADDEDLYWNTTLGKGRPAWNVQDPSMAKHTLGLQADLYCGGVDNLIRHHDYVIAIVEGVTGKPFARYWLHGEHLFVDGKKMSKSRGNIIYPKDLMERGCQWQHIRFFLINGYYRKRLNFTFDKFKKACDRLHRFKDRVKIIQGVKVVERSSTFRIGKLIDQIKTEFDTNMDNDLHVKRAFDVLFRIVSTLAELAEKGELSHNDAHEAIARLKEVDQVLQVIF